MNSTAILENATTIGLALLTVAVLLVFVRLARGPSLADRILALDTMNTLAIGYVATISIRTGIMLYLDIAIALGLVGFLSTIALARYLLHRAGAKAQGT